MLSFIRTGGEISSKARLNDLEWVVQTRMTGERGIFIPKFRVMYFMIGPNMSQEQHKIHGLQFLMDQKKF